MWIRRQPTNGRTTAGHKTHSRCSLPAKMHVGVGVLHPPPATCIQTRLVATKLNNKLQLGITQTIVLVRDAPCHAWIGALTSRTETVRLIRAEAVSTMLSLEYKSGLLLARNDQHSGVIATIFLVLSSLLAIFVWERKFNFQLGHKWTAFYEINLRTLSTTDRIAVRYTLCIDHARIIRIQVCT